MSEQQRFYFIGYNALGDTLCTTPVVQAYRLQNPEAKLIYICQDTEYCRVLEANPDLDLVIYNERMYFNGLKHYNNEWVRSLPLGLDKSPDFIHFDMQRVAKLPGAFEQHISKGYARLLGVETHTIRPVLKLSEQQEKQAAMFTPHPYVILGIHSVTNLPHADRPGGLKEWGLDNWLKLGKIIAEEYHLDVIVVGTEREAQPQKDYLRCLFGLPILVVAALLKNATCVITLESGLGHLSSAVDAPMVMLYSDIVPLGWANPLESTKCKVIYNTIHKIKLEEVLVAFEAIVNQ